MPTVTEIMSGTLEVPRSDHSYPASKVIESLDETDGLTPEFQTELDERVARWRSGKAKAVSSESLHREIEEILSQ